MRTQIQAASDEGWLQQATALNAGLAATTVSNTSFLSLKTATEHARPGAALGATGLWHMTLERGANGMWV